MREPIPLSVPNICGNEVVYAEQAIGSGWVSTAGSFVSDFEAAVSHYCNARSAVACQSGTAALHLGLLAAGVGRGQAVFVPTLTFIAAVNPVRYVDAMPIFIDCDDTLCMDTEKLASYCEEECVFDGDRLTHIATGAQVTAVVVVHVFGNLADMDRLVGLAEKYHLSVIEDATEALGSRWESGRFAGRFAGTVGTVGAFSFNGNKIITTGGGGMLVSNDEGVAARARYLSQQAKDDSLYFIHNEVGFNYRMTNLQAAVGLAQMEKLDLFIRTKERNYQRYQQDGVELLPFREGIRPNYWFYSYLTPYRDELMEYLSVTHAIQTRPIWHLIHSLRPYATAPHGVIDCAPNYVAQVVNLPCSTDLSEGDVDAVAAAVLAFSEDGSV